MAQIINVLAPAGGHVRVEIQKGIHALLFKIDQDFEALTGVKVSLEIQRNNKKNVEITKGFVPIMPFILAATFGDDAITSSPGFQTVAIVELAKMGAIEILPQDILIIEISGLGNYACSVDSYEHHELSETIYEYEQKVIPQDQKDYDLLVNAYDIMVVDVPQNGSLQELNFTHENGNVTKHTPFELQMVMQNQDPIAYVRNDFTVKSSFPTFLQLPLHGIKSINFRKATGTAINAIFREDIRLRELGIEPKKV